MSYRNVYVSYMKWYFLPRALLFRFIFFFFLSFLYYSFSSCYSFHSIRRSVIFKRARPGMAWHIVKYTGAKSHKTINFVPVHVCSMHFSLVFFFFLVFGEGGTQMEPASPSSTILLGLSAENHRDVSRRFTLISVRYSPELFIGLSQ